MTFIDWFAGVGGFRRGLELAGHKCVGFCEFDKFAVASYTSMHLITDEQREHLATMDLKKRQKEILKHEYRNGEWYARDIRTVNAADIPHADLWAFGFPCQDISVAGKMAGFSGNRSSLFFRVMQLIRDTAEDDRPKYLFIENVKNLLSINNGWDFAAVLYTLDECGYNAEWQIVNSKDYGVPQNRERVFIIGHSRNKRIAKVFPIGGTVAKNSVSLIGHRKGYHKNLQTYAPEGITETIDTAQGGGREPHIITSAVFAIDRNKKGTETEIARSSTARYDSGVHDRFRGENTAIAITVGNGTAPAIKQINAAARHFQEQIYDPSGIVSTLGATMMGSEKRVAVKKKEATHQEGVPVIWYEKRKCYIAIRKLTPRECFRLQGWADEYFERAQFVNSDSQLYKQAGNGVTVTVIQAIAERLEE